MNYDDCIWEWVEGAYLQQRVNFDFKVVVHKNNNVTKAHNLI